MGRKRREEMKGLDDKEIIETLDSILGVYIDMTHIAILTNEFRNRCRQVVNHLKQLISQEKEDDEIHLQMIDIILDLYERLEQSQERQVDEEWIEEKAEYLYNKAMHFYEHKENCTEFIHQIVQEIQKPRISKEFVEKFTERIYCNRKSIKAIRNNLSELFEEIGCEMEEDD